MEARNALASQWHTRPRPQAFIMNDDNTLPDDLAPPAGETLEAEMELQALRNDLQDANDRALRAQAEFENYRKRAQRDMADERKYAALPIVRDLLAVADNLELAIQAAEKDPGAAKVLEGVKMVLTQFNATLDQHEIRRIEGVGLPLDPNRQEAVMQEPHPNLPPGMVTRIVRSGYQLHDRVIRPAQVFVSRGPT
jgi:molecular chaperone GrpE